MFYTQEYGLKSRYSRNHWKEHKGKRKTNGMNNSSTLIAKSKWKLHSLYLTCLHKLQSNSFKQASQKSIESETISYSYGFRCSFQEVKRNQDIHLWYLASYPTNHDVQTKFTYWKSQMMIIKIKNDGTKIQSGRAIG